MASAKSCEENSARLLKKERATFERGDLRARALGTADGEAGAKASGDAIATLAGGLLRGAVERARKPGSAGTQNPEVLVQPRQARYIFGQPHNR